MLGHQLFRRLSRAMDARVTLRRSLEEYAGLKLFDEGNSYTGVDARGDAVERCIADFRPDAVINCVGIVKQLAAAQERIPSIEVNALFPHRLAAVCGRASARLIHVSTDCVFSGNQGMYRESDIPDASDLYGRTKLLGEVTSPRCLTLRTSIVGRELSRKTSLLEWFLSQQGRTVRGFRRAVFSGLSTIELSRVIEIMLTSFPAAHGLYHVSSEPINKYDLLMLFRTHMQLDIEIVPDDSFVCDRSLDSLLFRRSFGYQPPSWDDQVREIASSAAEVG